MKENNNKPSICNEEEKLNQLEAREDEEEAEVPDDDTISHNSIDNYKSTSNKSILLHDKEHLTYKCK